MGKLNWLDWLAYTLVIVGAINWGLIGFFGFDLVAAIFGGGATNTFSVLPRVIYAVVGLAGLYLIYVLFVKETAR
ncbi:TPA: DUF378 domain-containing protein [candidate division CPR2 bacterium]|uniref:DUF378 domain-containing protein n=1 Tax=candidate division CPR2 bacterium GW2011_GWC1_41_48 TaxID=1618344 RepID=A0A0G0WA28_UNCC2|nr:MAG: hypothetical protein UT47_C0001G0235 [candidate division CPR2 bacterium GW2011_GWC2_39_35]KKR28112.1 MAG: hypothetical protein UT60_C0027G0002 [candidate division CPR2 bacterium GW2011_GWD2_39_7]KKR29563.1 MAG: hypothetical protein UT59_C0005G0018 [candidate division CPR2 bacterium GW2011_GWD1_39_7]KKS09830.1 MAG: hypothetical protein UU65_C0001G0235 [candidate division CPR2 bacterium GW2011_GWC1_41_48]OGB55870.1 MAG: DUF378 domain-containing protein [candidate division CPR2 bacterium G